MPNPIRTPLPRSLPGAAILTLAALILLATARSEPILVLTYHRVTDEDGGPVPTVRPAEFARHLDLLARWDYRSIGPEELLPYLQGGRGLPRRAVLITFDDGWSDNYDTAWPLLRDRGFTATVFVVSGRIGKPGRLTARQLRTLAADGWAIGAHTVTHRHLPALSPSEARREIAASKAKVSRLLGRPVPYFAYPYGDFDARIRSQVRSAGFAMAFGTRLGFPRPGQDPWAVKRLTVPDRGGIFTLYTAVTPWFGPIRRPLNAILCTRPLLNLQAAYSRRLWRRSPRLPRRSP